MSISNSRIRSRSVLYSWSAADMTVSFNWLMHFSIALSKAGVDTSCLAWTSRTTLFTASAICWCFDDNSVGLCRFCSSTGTFGADNRLPMVTGLLHRVRPAIRVIAVITFDVRTAGGLLMPLGSLFFRLSSLIWMRLISLTAPTCLMPSPGWICESLPVQRPRSIELITLTRVNRGFGFSFCVSTMWTGCWIWGNVSIESSSGNVGSCSSESDDESDDESDCWSDC